MIPDTQRNADIAVFAIPLMWGVVIAAMAYWMRGYGMAKVLCLNYAVMVAVWFVALVALAHIENG